VLKPVFEVLIPPVFPPEKEKEIAVMVFEDEMVSVPPL
jgi:hypothetical protein